MCINKMLYALSKFSDTQGGNDAYHQRRVALIAYKLAQGMGFNDNGLELILQAGLLHDIGIISDVARVETFRQIIDEDFKRLTKHAVVSSRIVRYLNLHLDVSLGVSLHHTPKALNSSTIGSILFLADNIEVSFRSLSNPFAFNEMYDFIAQKSDIFDEQLLNVFSKLSKAESFWYDLQQENLDRRLLAIIDKHRGQKPSIELIKRIAYLAAFITDSISPFFDNYSIIAKNIVQAIGYKLNLDIEKLTLSVLFAHIGNIFIPSDMLGMDIPFEDVERNIIRSHPYYSFMLLDMMGIDEEVKRLASCHHEHRDSGYPFHNCEFDIYVDTMRLSTILAALIQDRPYRIAYDYEKAKDIINNMDFDENVVNIALKLDLERIVNAEDDYYEGLRRLFV